MSSSSVTNGPAKHPEPRTNTSIPTWSDSEAENSAPTNNCVPTDSPEPSVTESDTETLPRQLVESTTLLQVKESVMMWLEIETLEFSIAGPPTVSDLSTIIDPDVLSSP
jgi:hypothetical protein